MTRNQQQISALRTKTTDPEANELITAISMLERSQREIIHLKRNLPRESAREKDVFFALFVLFLHTAG